MTVFNNSVENHVEKTRERIKTPRKHEAYSSLHKFCASETERENFFAKFGFDAFLGRRKSFAENPEMKKLPGELHQYQ